MYLRNLWCNVYLTWQAAGFHRDVVPLLGPWHVSGHLWI